MQAFLFFTGLLALIWSIWKLGEPWRRYHAEHIAPLEKELAAVRSRCVEKKKSRGQAVADAELFTRDFRAEVHRHQKAKNEAYDALNPLRERKSNLHDEIKDVRSSLDRWHRSSKSVFGNKGRKIEDDSVLGWLGLVQTVAQKEKLERRRDDLSAEIVNLNDEMSDIYERRIEPAKKGIKSAFDDEKRLKRIRQEGLDERHFLSKAGELDAAISASYDEIARLKAAIANARDGYKKHREA